MSRTTGTGSGSKGTLDQSMLSADALGNSFLSNNSFDHKLEGSRHSMGSIDQIVLDDDQEKSMSVKFVQNQQIVEADNCCF